MRKVWIWILSGLAVVLGSFVLVRCIHREQPCYYGPPVKDDPPQDTIVIKDTTQMKKELRQRLDSIRAIIEEREFAEVYGPPEIIEEYSRETRRLKQEAEELESQLKDLDNE